MLLFSLTVIHSCQHAVSLAQVRLLPDGRFQKLLGLVEVRFLFVAEGKLHSGITRMVNGKWLSGA